jgi:hypothetical protein
MVKPRRMKAAYMEEMRNAYTILVKKLEDKRPLGRPWRRGVNSITRSSGKN